MLGHQTPLTCVDDGDDADNNESVSVKSATPLDYKSLFYGSASHRKCTICLQSADAGLVSLLNFAKQQLIFFH